MKKLLASLVIITLSISTVFAYELSVQDKNLLQAIKPALEKKYVQGAEWFQDILSRINDIFPVLKPNTRSYELILGLKGNIRYYS